MRTRGALPINVKVVIEGEEEIGSPNFDAALEQLSRSVRRRRCGYLRHGGVFRRRSFAHDVRTRPRALGRSPYTVQPQMLHSGYYGGILANPIEALAQIIAGLKDGRWTRDCARVSTTA